MTISDTPQRHVIEIERNGQYLRITEEHIQNLGDITATEIVCGDDCSCTPVERSLLRIAATYNTGSGDERSGICPVPNAGCLPILQSCARRNGAQLRITSTTPIASLPAPVESSIAGYPALHEFVRQHERGLLKVSKGFDAAIIPWELIKAFPNLRLIVIGTRVRDLTAIRDRLAPDLGAQVQVVHSRRQFALQADEQPPQVCCCTPTYAGDMDLSVCDVVLVLDAYLCTRQAVQSALAEQDAAFRLFGIVRSGSTPSPFEEAKTLATFGPELIDVMNFRKVRRHVQVAWTEHCQPDIRCHHSSNDLGPRCYWRNNDRNAAIARLADEFTDGAVTILVDRPQHAVALARLLPDWTLFAGDDSANGMPGSIRRRVLRDRCQWQNGRRQIVLMDAARNFGGRCSDVVIWAGGGLSRAPVPLSWMADDSVSDRPLLIVDFVDRFNRHALTMSRQRRSDYENNDIFDIDVSPAQGRIRRILAAQRRAI